MAFRWVVLLCWCVACGGEARPAARDGGPADATLDGAPSDVGADGPGFLDVGPVDAPFNPDAACAVATERATTERAPVDIIWMIDSSVSMQPAIEQVQAGINDFVALVGARDLDYRVIMLTLRGRGEVSVGSGRRFQLCVPPPLAGDDDCGDGERFFHVPVDVYSTQLFEQFLGTLSQTNGYLEGQSHGGPPWRELLRDGATKTLVFVSDDDSRLSPDQFENYPGGANPFNSRTLGPGILHESWGGLFEGYTFSGLYGWGSETDPSARCEFPDGTLAAKSGVNYTTLVNRTGGARAQICDAAGSWSTFLDAITTAVERTSRVDCTIPIPEPPDGVFFDASRINVFTRDGDAAERVGRVPGEEGCDEARGGWYYDDPAAPTEVELCPASCERVQGAPGVERGVEIQFGCQSIPI